jgi:hypothetical protein
MSTGGFLFLVAVMLPRIFAPDTPHGVFVAALVLLLLAALLFIAGSCIYARGIGYPFWLGIFGITFIGLIILMLLPDRHPEPDEADF